MKASSLSTRTLFIIVIVGIALIGGGLLIGQTMPSFFPPEASAQSQQIDALFKVLLVIGGAIFLLVEGLLLYSVIAFRAKPGDKTDGPHIHGNTTLEIVWTAIPAVVVLRRDRRTGRSGRMPLPGIAGGKRSSGQAGG